MLQADQKMRRIESALSRLSEHETRCRLCPRECGVNRTRGEKGFCQSGARAAVSHALLHYGEEPVLSGHRDWAERTRPVGSGTIFFAGCNLKCSFCQNFQLSWLGRGKLLTDEELAGMMLGLQAQGALNINLVSPTHLILPILKALWIAYRRGLSLPLVYNSNGYEKAEVLIHLDEIIDIYLPDLKYHSTEAAGRFSAAPDYFSRAAAAIKEMFCQQPGLVLDPQGIARRGLIVRHLILPGQTKESLALLEWLAAEVSTAACLSLMSQYQPCFLAPEELQRPLRADEYQEVVARAEELGFDTLFVQPAVFDPAEHLVPDFSLDHPFPWGDKPKSR